MWFFLSFGGSSSQAMVYSDYLIVGGLCCREAYVVNVFMPRRVYGMGLSCCVLGRLQCLCATGSVNAD
jgi:hypothetical protein